MIVLCNECAYNEDQMTMKIDVPIPFIITKRFICASVKGIFATDQVALAHLGVCWLHFQL